MSKERWVQGELPGFSEESEIWVKENAFRREYGFPEIELDDAGLPIRTIMKWPSADELRAVLPSQEEIREQLRKMRLRVPFADSDTLKIRLTSAA